jgi:hypothetical protein
MGEWLNKLNRKAGSSALLRVTRKVPNEPMRLVDPFGIRIFAPWRLCVSHPCPPKRSEMSATRLQFLPNEPIASDSTFKAMRKWAIFGGIRLNPTFQLLTELNE